MLMDRNIQFVEYWTPKQDHWEHYKTIWYCWYSAPNVILQCFPLYKEVKGVSLGYSFGAGCARVLEVPVQRTCWVLYSLWLVTYIKKCSNFIFSYEINSKKICESYNAQQWLAATLDCVSHIHKHICKQLTNARFFCNWKINVWRNSQGSSKFMIKSHFYTFFH